MKKTPAFLRLEQENRLLCARVEQLQDDVMRAHRAHIASLEATTAQLIAMNKHTAEQIAKAFASFEGLDVDDDDLPPSIAKRMGRG